MKHVVESAKFSGEPVYINKDGEIVPYIPVDIVGQRSAYAATLHLVFQHSADVYLSMLEIVADKYNIEVNDMIQTVMDDTRFKDMIVNPKLESMTYFEKEDLEKVVPAATEKKEIAEKPKKKRTVKSAATSEPAPVRKVLKIKRTTET